MRVLLVQPTAPRTHWPRGGFRSRWVPSGLAFLAGALRRAGHSVRVLVREEQLVKLGYDWASADADLRKLLEEFRPEAVGCTVMTPFVAETEFILRAAREIVGPHVLTLAGGPHATALPERTLRDCPSLDAVLLGEAEFSIVALLEKGTRADIPGLLCRGQVQTVPVSPSPPLPVPPHDLDALGDPPYDLFDMGYYTAPDWSLVRWLEVRALNIRTSRGCTNRCAFCAGPLVSGPGVRMHSTEYILAQMRRAVAFGARAVHFEDDTVGADRARLLALCEGIRREGLQESLIWDACLRVDQAEAELLAAMKSAGCIQVEYGFESGSDEMLRRIGKNATREMNLRAARLTHEAGLRVFADILAGLPGETESDLKATVSLVRQIRPDVVSFGQTYPLPGSALYDALPQAVRESLNWGDFAYPDQPNYPINITAIPDARYSKRFKTMERYFFRPLMTAQLLRDAAPSNLPRQSALQRKVRRFALRHPLRALRLPRGGPPLTPARLPPPANRSGATLHP